MSMISRQNNVFNSCFKHGHCFFLSQKLEGKIMVRSERTGCFPRAWSLVINSPLEEWGVSHSEQPQGVKLSVYGMRVVWAGSPSHPRATFPPVVSYGAGGGTVCVLLSRCSLLKAAVDMALDKSKYRVFIPECPVGRVGFHEMDR